MRENILAENFVATKVIEVPKSSGFISLGELALGHMTSNPFDVIPAMVGIKQTLIRVFSSITGRKVFVIPDFSRVSGVKLVTIATENILINVPEKDSEEIKRYEVPVGSIILTNDNMSTLGKLLSPKSFKRF